MHVYNCIRLAVKGSLETMAWSRDVSRQFFNVLILNPRQSFRDQDQDRDSTSETKTKTKTLPAETKTKTPPSETKTKTKTLKNCLETSRDQDSVSRRSITVITSKTLLECLGTHPNLYEVSPFDHTR